MNGYSCVIFDIDGTLTQTNTLIFDTFNHVTGKYLQKTYTPKEIVAMFGPPEEIAIERLVGPDRIDNAMKDFISYYEKHFPGKAEIFTGIREILEFLKTNGLRLAVFTGKGRSTTLITLDLIGITKYFDIIVTGSDVVNHKPSAEGIRRILEKFNLPPERALMVGDAVSDIKAAHEAGVPVAAVVWDSYAKDKVMGMDVDFLFHNVEDFDRWIKTRITGTGVKAV
ncbi:MAG: HAD family hydrolase [Bacteroidota bacterium]